MHEVVRINEVEFVIEKFNPFVAWKLLGDLQKEFMPIVSEVMGAMDKDKQSDAELIQAFLSASSRIDGALLEKWRKLLITEDNVSVTINGQTQKLSHLNEGFAFEDFTAIIELLYHVIRINFARP